MPRWLSWTRRTQVGRGLRGRSSINSARSTGVTKNVRAKSQAQLSPRPSRTISGVIWAVPGGVRITGIPSAVLRIAGIRSG